MEIISLHIHNIAYFLPCLGQARQGGEAGRPGQAGRGGRPGQAGRGGRSEKNLYRQIQKDFYCRIAWKDSEAVCNSNICYVMLCEKGQSYPI